MFKILFYCFCICATVYARSEDEIRDEFLKISMTCLKDHKATPDEIEMLHRHKIPDSENARCLISCVYKKVGWINDNGLFDLDAAKSFANGEHLQDATKLENSKKLFDFCKTVNDEKVSDGEKGCERSALLSQCLLDNTSKFGFKIPLP